MSSSSRYQRIEDFGLARTPVAMEDFIANYEDLLAGINPLPSLRRYQITTRGGRTVHEYNVSVPSRTYIVTSAFLMFDEARGGTRTTRMRLHQMILANFYAEGAGPRQLTNIVFTEITNSIVQQAINRDYRDLCQMGEAPATSEVISLIPDFFTDWQARVNRNPFLRCVVNLLGEINRRHPGRNFQIREVRYSAVDDWSNVAFGYHMAVSLGPPTALAVLRPQPQQQLTVPQYYARPSYGGYNVTTYDFSNINYGQY